MYKRSTLYALFTTFLAVALFQATDTPACPPEPLGLEALIETSVQAIEVEILEVERAKPPWLVRGASLLREIALNSSQEVSEDLALLIREKLPEIDIDSSSFLVHARVLGHFDSEGPEVGNTFTWTYTGYGYWEFLRPPQEAILFLDHRFPKLPLLGLAPISEVEGLRTFARHQDLAEVKELVRRGFEDKHAGRLANLEWLEAAFRSPTSRLLMSHSKTQVERLTPDLVADALLERPTGTASDIYYLEQLAAIPHSDLDLFVLELAGAYQGTEPAYLAERAMRVALERWELDTELPSCDDYQDFAQCLAEFWHLKVEQQALPVATNARIQAELDAWTWATEEAKEFRKELLAAQIENEL